MTDTETLPEHHGQHKERCGPCNGWRYDRLMERKAAGEDPNRVVEPEEGWRWDKAEETSEAGAKWAAKILERCFKGSQQSFVAGLTTPGSIGVTNFIVGMALAMEKPGTAKRLIGGLQRGAAKATGMPVEHFEKEFKEMMSDLERIFREEGGEW